MTQLQVLIIVLMGLSLAESGYLLWLLYRRLRTVYGSVTAWRFIFAAFVQMFLEILLGTAMVLPWSMPRWLRVGLVVTFCVLMLTKVTCHVIGFTMWAGTRKHLLDPKRWAKTEEDSQWKSSSESQEPQQ